MRIILLNVLDKQVFVGGTSTLHSDDAESLRAHVGPQVKAVEASSRQSGT